MLWCSDRSNDDKEFTIYESLHNIQPHLAWRELEAAVAGESPDAAMFA